MSQKEIKIVGYFHICQKGDWQKSFDIIMNAIRCNDLYSNTDEIRCGIVNNHGGIIDDIRLHDDKIKIVAYKNESEYERATLLHMKEFSHFDPENTVYWYLHTKGIRHFGTYRERNVIDWINFMLYWNILHWKLAVHMLNYYDSYGCNGVGNTHYSGNFWWATSSHIKNLHNHINPDYYAPEFWICSADHKMCNIYSCGLEGGRNYDYPLPLSNYVLPHGFDIEVYRYFNADLTNIGYSNLISHYLYHGKNENRIYLLPKYFDLDFYKNLYNLNNYTSGEILWNWLSHGIYYNYRYSELIPDGFEQHVYRTIYLDIAHFNIYDLITHYIEYGRNENRSYKLPDNFDLNYYRENNNMVDFSDTEIIWHWFHHGQYENRKYSKSNLDTVTDAVTDTVTDAVTGPVTDSILPN